MTYYEALQSVCRGQMPPRSTCHGLCALQLTGLMDGAWCYSHYDLMSQISTHMPDGMRMAWERAIEAIKEEEGVVAPPVDVVMEKMARVEDWKACLSDMVEGGIPGPWYGLCIHYGVDGVLPEETLGRKIMCLNSMIYCAGMGELRNRGGMLCCLSPLLSCSLTVRGVTDLDETVEKKKRKKKSRVALSYCHWMVDGETGVMMATGDREMANPAGWLARWRARETLWYGKVEKSGKRPRRRRRRSRE